MGTLRYRKRKREAEQHLADEIASEVAQMHELPERVHGWLLARLIIRGATRSPRPEEALTARMLTAEDGYRTRLVEREKLDAGPSKLVARQLAEVKEVDEADWPTAFAVVVDHMTGHFDAFFESTPGPSARIRHRVMDGRAEVAILENPELHRRDVWDAWACGFCLGVCEEVVPPEARAAVWDYA
jgi:hypothetical protein